MRRRVPGKSSRVWLRFSLVFQSDFHPVATDVSRPSESAFRLHGSERHFSKWVYTMRMNASGETDVDTKELERQLHKLLAPGKLPSYIESARYEFDTDHIGLPALRIFLAIKPETDALMSRDKVKLKAYGDYTDELRSRILKLETGYFPFIRLVEAA